MEGPNNRNLLVGVGAAAGVVATLLFTSIFARPSDIAINNSASSNVWVLAVTLRFRTVVDKADFHEIFAPLATYVQKNEPDTLSYVLSESDKDPKQVFILERYSSKSAYLDVHKVSKEFKGFREMLMAMQKQGRVTVDGHSYSVSAVQCCECAMRATCVMCGVPRRICHLQKSSCCLCWCRTHLPTRTHPSLPLLLPCFTAGGWRRLHHSLAARLATRQLCICFHIVLNTYTYDHLSLPLLQLESSSSPCNNWYVRSQNERCRGRHP